MYTVYLKLQNGGSGACQLRQGFSIKTPIMDTLFELQHLEYIAEFSKALLCQLCARWQLGSDCGEVLKAMCAWSRSKVISMQ